MNVVFHQGALGDWVLTFPVLRALGPTVAVTAIGKAQLAARVIGHVQPCDIEQRDAALLHVQGGADQVSQAWRRQLAQASLIISFVSDGDDGWADNIRTLAPGARLAFVQPKPPAQWAKHVCDWHDHQLRQQGVQLAYTEVAARPNTRGPIVIHPGSGSAEKCWPAQRFASLCTSLRQGGRQVRMVLGEVELDRWPHAQLQHWVTQLHAERIETLAKLEETVGGASVYIGNDSGPTHLAAALGIDTIALFGPTDARTWSPRGPVVTVVAPRGPDGRAAPMTWLDEQTLRSYHSAL